MAYGITGATATITSITSGTDVYQLCTQALKQTQFRVSQTADEFDITELSGSGGGAEFVAGLAHGMMDFEGHYPKSSPVMGNSGLVTYSDGYVQRVSEWKIDVDFGEIPITWMTGSAVLAKKFMPMGVYSWNGSYVAQQVDSTAISGPSAAGYAGGSATFKITEDSTDPALSGSIIVTGVSQTIRKADLIGAEYTFRGSGAITETKGSTLPGLRRTSTGAWGTPDWDTDDNGTPEMVFTLGGSSKTITSTVFLKSMSIECKIGEPVKVTGTIRFSGSVVRA